MAYKKPEYKLKKAPQNLNEEKSKGQINRAKTLNVLATLKTELFNRNIIPQIVDVVEKEIKKGKIKNGIELLKLLKEPDKQEINTSMIQKVFVTPEELKEVDRHIKDFINSD